MLRLFHLRHHMSSRCTNSHTPKQKPGSPTEANKGKMIIGESLFLMSLTLGLTEPSYMKATGAPTANDHDVLSDYGRVERIMFENPKRPSNLMTGI